MKNFTCGNIEVMGNDYPIDMSWREAVLVTREESFKKDGWRLPLIEELEYLYTLHVLNIGNFENLWYWAIPSYNERYNIWNSNYVLSFKIPIYYGYTTDKLTSHNYKFRLVKDLDEEKRIKAFERIDLTFISKG